MENTNQTETTETLNTYTCAWCGDTYRSYYAVRGLCTHCAAKSAKAKARKAKAERELWENTDEGRAEIQLRADVKALTEHRDEVRDVQEAIASCTKRLPALEAELVAVRAAIGDRLPTVEARVAEADAVKAARRAAWAARYESDADSDVN